jgi:hypothetical protein
VEPEKAVPGRALPSPVHRPALPSHCTTLFRVFSAASCGRTLYCPKGASLAGRYRFLGAYACRCGVFCSTGAGCRAGRALFLARCCHHSTFTVPLRAPVTSCCCPAPSLPHATAGAGQGMKCGKRAAAATFCLCRRYKLSRALRLLRTCAFRICSLPLTSVRGLLLSVVRDAAFGRSACPQGAWVRKDNCLLRLPRMFRVQPLPAPRAFPLILHVLYFSSSMSHAAGSHPLLPACPRKVKEVLMGRCLASALQSVLCLEEDACILSSGGRRSPVLMPVA